MGSMAYVDATFQIRPETLDMFLWLGLTVALLLGKFKSSIVFSVLGVYNHGLASLAMNGLPILSTRNKKLILIITLASLPIVILSFMYLVPMLGTWMNVAVSEQARQFMNDWAWFTYSYLGSLLLGLPVAFYMLIKWKTLTSLSKLCLLTLASSLIMIPVWYDRYYHYASMPLALLLGTFTVEHRKLAIAIIAFAVYFLVVTYAKLWIANFMGLWDIH